MKSTKVLFLGAFLFAGAASAQVIEVTFARVGDARMQLGELCGRVSGVEQLPTFVKLTIDYDSGYAGTYNTMVTEDGGGFCQIVRTVLGRAKAEIVGFRASSTATLK